MTADWIIIQLITLPLRTTVQDGQVTNLIFIFRLFFISKAPQKTTCKEAKVLGTNSKYKNVLSFNLQSLTLRCRLWNQLDKRLLSSSRDFTIRRRYGSENVAQKVNLRCCSPIAIIPTHLLYQKLANPPGDEFLRSLTKFRERMSN